MDICIVVVRPLPFIPCTLMHWQRTICRIENIKRIDVDVPYLNTYITKYAYLVCVMVVIVWLLDVKLLAESGHFTTNVYSIQHCVIKFVSDFRQVGGFLRVLRFAPPIKLTATI
jgi:hypothetical protein